jgi:hypothetical protein
MISFITDDFLKLFAKLPKEIQSQAKKCYQIWKKNPYHPSLQFKQIHPIEPIWSVRIGIGWRALGLRDVDLIYWFWIGSHSDYDKLIDAF